MNLSTSSVCSSHASWHSAAALASALRSVSRRALLGLFAAVLAAPLAHAQSNYATPYFFTTLAGSPGLPGTVDGKGSAARFNGPQGVTVDANGVVFTGDYAGHWVRKITPFAEVVSFATDPGTTASLFPGNSIVVMPPLGPVGVAVDGGGIVYVADYNTSRIRKITAAGSMTILAGATGLGGLFGTSTVPAPGSTNGTGTAAKFSSPYGLALDKDGNVYVGDEGNHLIRKITPGGVVTTLAGLAGSPGSIDGAGAAARFNLPLGVAVDGGSNVYVADYGNHTIRKITPGGVVTTLAGLAGSPGSLDANGTAARFRNPQGVAADSSGNVYVADTANHTIRKITPGGDVTTLAGGPNGGSAGNSGSADGAGSAARFSGPTGIALDGAGNLYVADRDNHTIRMSVVPPRFATHPAPQTVTLGATATFTATTATSNVPITYQWSKDGVAIPAATSLTLNVLTAQALNVGSYTVVATNAAGSTTSNPAVLTLSLAPNFTTQPASQSVPPGTIAAFTATVTSATPTSYQWQKDSVSIPGATTATLIVNNVQTVNLGNYTLVATNSVSSTTSNVAVLTFLVPPNFTTQPATQSVTPGTTATFTAGATGNAPTTYQWQKDGVTIPGATNATLTVTNVQLTNLGNYAVIATNTAGSSTSNPAALSFIVSTAGRLTNLSIRSGAGTGAQVLIVGLVIGGTDTAGTKPLLIRGVGPALGGFGVPGFLVDPTLSVFSGTTIVASNDNWSGDAQVSGVGTQVGAFAFPSTTSRDAALYHAGLAAGAYTVQVSGVGGTTGVALAEIYDATPANIFVSSTPRLVNVSARTQVGTGADILITGFSIGGATAKTLLIRAVGPTLSVFGVTSVLADPKLDLFSGPTLLQSNDNWGGGALITTAATNVGAFALDAASKDAVLLVTLQPGSYTAQVSGVGNTTGVALVEIYEVP